MRSPCGLSTVRVERAAQERGELVGGQSLQQPHPGPRGARSGRVRLANSNPQGLPMRGLRYRVEDASYECAAAVGLHDLDLEELARLEAVEAERRHAAHPDSRRVARSSCKARQGC